MRKNPSFPGGWRASLFVGAGNHGKRRNVEARLVYSVDRWLLGLLILGPIGFGILAIIFGLDANWDLRNYHRYVAYAFLTGRFGFDRMGVRWRDCETLSSNLADLMVFCAIDRKMQ